MVSSKTDVKMLRKYPLSKPPKWAWDGTSPPVLKHGVLENGPLVNDFSIKTSIHGGFSSQPGLMKPESEGILLHPVSRGRDARSCRAVDQIKLCP